jgi:hypothetical protein
MRSCCDCPSLRDVVPCASEEQPQEKARKVVEQQQHEHDMNSHAGLEDVFYIIDIS